MKAKYKNNLLILRLKLAVSAIVTLFGLDEQRNRLEPITADSVDPIDAELAETITLGDATARKFAKHLRRATNKDWRNAFATLLGLPHAIEDSALGWSMFLLCLLSTVAELVIGTIPSLPLIVLTGLTAAPCALRTLIESFSPLRKLAGKRGCVKRPTVLEATAPLGSTAVSSGLVDYLGGNLKVTGYGKLRAWLPLALVPIAVAANVPSAVVDVLLTSSPFALLAFCGVRKLNSSRFTFRWDGITFESADLTLLNDAKAQMSLIQAELLCFCEYIRATKGRRKYIRAKKQEELDAKVQELENLMSVGVDIGNNTTFCQLAQQWYGIYKKPNLRLRSQNSIKNVLNTHILPKLGGYLPREITPMQIQALMVGLSGKSNSLQSKVLAYLRDIFKIAEENGLVAKSPVSDRIKAGGKETEEKQPLTPDEAKLLLSDELAACLLEQRKKAVSEYIFAMKDGKPLTKSAYRSMFRLIERELPERHITAHILRHTYITRLFEAGLDIKEIQHLAGHSTVEMTLSIYTHYDHISRAEETASKVRAAFA